jgi:spore germination cell wall hydrolase CwlJ-like protein
MFASKSKSIAAVLVVAILAYTFPTLAQSYLEDQIQTEVSKDFNKQLTCLTNNIYFEAATEPYEGKLAVAQVVLNRSNNPNFPSTVCEVVYQRTITQNRIVVCQFSWTCLKHLVVRDQYAWEESEIVARKALTQAKIHDRISSTNALYYHADYINPGWRLKRVYQIGHHIFYNDN